MFTGVDLLQQATCFCGRLRLAPIASDESSALRAINVDAGDLAFAQWPKSAT